MARVRRALTGEDIQECLRMRREHLIIPHHLPHHLEHDIYDDTAIHVLATKGNIPIGCGRAILHTNGTAAVISSVVVDPAYRGIGVGSKIIRAIELAPEILHVASILLDAEISAIPFYEQHDFKAIGKEFMAFGIMCRRMEKTRICATDKPLLAKPKEEHVPLFDVNGHLSSDA